MVFSLDFETTGLDTAVDRVVQVGIAVAHADGECRGFSSLVRPDHPISPSASAVNGLSDADVASAPPFPRVWEQVLEFVAKRSIAEPPAVLTWNGWCYDWPLLFAELARYGLQRPLWRFLDLKPYASRPASLEPVCERYGVILDRAKGHDAGRDAAAVLGVYAKMRARGHCPDVSEIWRTQKILLRIR